MSKNYTVEEVAKKFSVSTGHIYELIKQGKILKVPNLGKTIRIPSSELTKMKVNSSNLLYLPEKVEAIKTSLGTVRKIKGKDSYVLIDIVKALGVNNSYRIIRTIGNDFVAKLTTDGARDLGLFANQTGILLISSTGIKQYSSKSRNKVMVENFIKELNLDSEPKKDFKNSVNNIDLVDNIGELKDDLIASVEINGKEIDNTQSALQIFEGQEVEIIEVNGDILFELYSTGMALGYLTSNGYAYKTRIDTVVENAELSTISHGVKKYLTEPMLYDFMLEAKTQKCKPFRKWVTNDVLPSIRKTGSYSIEKTKSESSNHTIIDNPYINFSIDTQKLMLEDLYKANSEMLEKVRLNTRAIAKLENLLEGGC